MIDGETRTLKLKGLIFTGIYLDDFVKDPVTRPDGRKVGKPAMTEAELKSMRELLTRAALSTRGAQKQIY